jgi:hypothetical protein
MEGEIVYCLPVYSTFIERPPENIRSEVRGQIGEVKTGFTFAI